MLQYGIVMPVGSCTINDGRDHRSSDLAPLGRVPKEGARSNNDKRRAGGGPRSSSRPLASGPGLTNRQAIYLTLLTTSESVTSLLQVGLGIDVSMLGYCKVDWRFLVGSDRIELFSGDQGVFLVGSVFLFFFLLGFAGLYLTCTRQTRAGSPACPVDTSLQAGASTTVAADA